MKLEQLEMNQHFQFTDTQEKKYYIVYCRKSEEAEDRQVASIPDQLQIANNIISSKNLSCVLDPFTEARSAKKPGRIEFNRMVAEIDKRNDIKGIIVWKLNRLFRNPEDEGKIRQRLSDGRISEIITPSKTYYEADSDFIMAVEGAQAQRFIKDLREDTARGIKSKLDKGIAPILAPIGYRNTKEKKQGERDIQPHPIYFSLMKQLHEIFLTGHYSVEQLHKRAVEMSIKNNRNQIISRTQLFKTLKDPFYTGTRFVYAKRLYTNGIHEPMITDEQYDLAQDILSKRSRPRAAIHKGFLNGLVRCGECGGMITAEVHTKKYKSGKTQEFAYYRCSKRKKDIKCHQPYIPVDTLDAQASVYLKSVMLSSRFVEWAIKWFNVMHEEQTKIKDARLIATQQQYNEVVNKITRLVDLMIEGVISPKEGALRKQVFEEEKTRLFKILSGIDTHITEWTNLTIQTFDFVKTAQEKFSHGTIEQKKTILKVIGSNLILKNKKLTIELRTPFTYIQNAVKEINSNNEFNFNELTDLTSQRSVFGSNQYLMGDWANELRTQLQIC